MPRKDHKVLLVSYDLFSPEEGNYEGLFDALKNSPGWWHYLATTWLVCTADSPEVLGRKLEPFLAKKDRMFIIEVAPRYYGMLPDKAWKWMEKTLPRQD